MALEEILGSGDFLDPPRSASRQKGMSQPNANDRVFYVLRGLDANALNAKANEICTVAARNGVKSFAIITSEDFLLNDAGTYVFDPVRLKAAHRRNFERACALFSIGIEVVVLANLNIRKSHYYHYLTMGRFFYYDTVEEVVGQPYDLSKSDAETLAKKSYSNMPASVFLRYSLEFEE